MYSNATGDDYHLDDVKELIKEYHYVNRIRDWETWLKVEPQFVPLCRTFQTDSVLDLHDSFGLRPQKNFDPRSQNCGKLSFENRVLRYYDDCSGCRCGPWPGSPCCCNFILDKDVPTFDIRFRIEKGVIYGRDISPDAEDDAEKEVDPLELLFALTARHQPTDPIFEFFIDSDYPILEKLKELGRSKKSIEERVVNAKPIKKGWKNRNL